MKATTSTLLAVSALILALAGFAAPISGRGGTQTTCPQAQTPGGSDGPLGTRRQSEQLTTRNAHQVLRGRCT